MYVLNRSVHTSANLIFHFSNKNGKRKYIIFAKFKVQKKREKKKMVGKIDHFFHFSNFEVKFKNTENTVNG